MKHQYIKNLIFSITLLTLVSTNMQGQVCYNILEDPSGYNNNGFNGTFEAAACDLRDAFPLPFKDSFMVYDAGYYIETGPFGESYYTDRFEELKTEAASRSPYYLLFARKSNPDALNNTTCS